MGNPLLQHNLVKYVKFRITFFSEQPCDGKVDYLISHNITTLLYLQHVVFWHMSHDSNKTPFENNVSDAILVKIKTFSYYYDDFIFRQHVTYITHHALQKLRHGFTLQPRLASSFLFQHCVCVCTYREVVGVLFFHCVCFGDQVQFLRLGGKYSYLQSLLTSPEVSFLKEPFTWTSDCALSSFSTFSQKSPSLCSCVSSEPSLITLCILTPPCGCHYQVNPDIISPYLFSELIDLHQNLSSPSTSISISINLFALNCIQNLLFLSLRPSFQIRNLPPSLIPNSINHQRN